MRFLIGRKREEKNGTCENMLRCLSRTGLFVLFVAAAVGLVSGKALANQPQEDAVICQQGTIEVGAPECPPQDEWSAPLGTLNEFTGNATPDLGFDITLTKRRPDSVDVNVQAYKFSIDAGQIDPSSVSPDTTETGTILLGTNTSPVLTACSLVNGEATCTLSRLRIFKVWVEAKYKGIIITSPTFNM